MVEQKATRNLRMRTKVGHFTYNGFLRCAKCGDRLHTFRNQFDRYYYICSNKKRKDEAGDFLCRIGFYETAIDRQVLALHQSHFHTAWRTICSNNSSTASTPETAHDGSWKM